MEGIELRNDELANGWVSIVVAGEIDLATVGALEEAIEGVFGAAEKDLVVDLTGSSFMDSTGLKALVMAHRRFSDAGRGFALAVSGGPVSRLIDLSGVSGSIRTVDNTEELGAADS